MADDDSRARRLYNYLTNEQMKQRLQSVRSTAASGARSVYGGARAVAPVAGVALGGVAAGAAVVGGGTKSVAVKGFDSLKNTVSGLRPDAPIPFPFILVVVLFQFYELAKSYSLPQEARLFIYFTIAVVASALIKIPWKQSIILSALSFFVPMVWKALPANVVQSPFFALFNILILSFAIAWTWAFVFSPNAELSGFIRIIVIAAFAYGLIWPQLANVASAMGIDTEPLNVSPQFTIKAFESGFQKSLETVNKFPAWIDSEWNNYIHGVTGDLYTGKVDDNTKRQVGVYIDKFEPDFPEYFEGQKVTAFAYLKAQTLDSDTSIRIRPKCWVDKGLRSELQGTVKPFELQVDTYDYRPFDCSFERLKQGSRTLTATATFNFSTLAYLKTYFMDKDKLMSIRQNGKEPLDFYKIEDKTPQAVFTNGPVYIGMEVVGALPIGLKPGDTNPLALGVTLKNFWNGKIESVHSVTISLPEGVEVDPQYGCSIPFTLSDTSDHYNTYSLDMAAVRSKNPKAFSNIKQEQYQSFRCFIKVKDDSIKDLLGSTPITVKFFRASANYDYTIENQVSLEVKEKETVGIDCGSKVLELARKGLDRPYADGATWPSDKDPEKGQPIDHAAFSGWVFSSYSSIYKDSKLSLSNSISDQATVGTVVDGDMSQPSKPDYGKIQDGDLMFFCGSYDAANSKYTDCSAGIGHVAIYTGDSRIIHVTNSVTEEVLSGSELEQNYVGSRRLCAEKKSVENAVSSGSIIETLYDFADKYRVPRDVAYKVAYVESGGSMQHYGSAYDPFNNCDGKVLCGDGGYSLGLMQINTKSNAHPQCYGSIVYDPGSGDMCIGAEHCSGTDVRDLDCNIEASMRLLSGCYSQGQSNPNQDCYCNGQNAGWDYALKCYNGCGCNNPIDYVAKVNGVVIT